MTITDLITRLRIQIRDTGQTQALADAEVTQFIQDGLATYSQYRPRKRRTNIQVLAGQSIYTLPSDWIDRDYESFEEAIAPPKPIDPYRQSPYTFLAVTQITAQPMGVGIDVQYDFYPYDLQMVITPVPQSSYTLSFDYYAVHTADNNGVSVPMLDIDNALLPGAEKALESIATDYSVKLQKYKMGNNIQVDDSTISAQLNARADALRVRFERDVIKRPIGVMG